MGNHCTELFTNKFKLFITGILICVSGFLITSCSTTGKAGRKKNCDCPRWSSIDKPADKMTEVYEKF